VGPSKVTGLPEWTNKSATKISDTMNKSRYIYHSFGRVMQKLYTKNIDREPIFFAGLVICVFVIGLLLFHPSLSLLHRVQRRQQLDYFLSEVKQDNFTMKQFWQFREFYSPGNFHFNSKSVTLAGALQFNDISEPKTTLLEFSSPKLISSDGIIDKKITNNLLNFREGAPILKILFQAHDRIVYQTVDNKIHFIFLRSSEEMMSTLGLFDYGRKEKTILENKLWLNVTSVSP